MPELVVSDPDLDVWLGDAVESLRQLPDGYAQTCVTSPPFYALRDYGVDRQIGLEPSLEEWVAALVAVFAEVRRVLRPDGTLWLELADSYCAGDRGRYAGDGDRQQTNQATVGSYPTRPVLEGLKPKDLLGAPFEVAMALRADGWYWRQTIIWHKRNAMPESAKDRPTTAHSYVFLMSPSSRYFYDDDAIAEPAEWARWGAQDAGKYETVGKGSMVQPLTREQIARRFGGGRQRGQGQEGAYKTTEERNARFQGSVELSADDDQRLFDVTGEPVSARAGWHDHSADLERGNSKQRTAVYRRSRSVWSLASEPNRLAVCPVCDAFWDGDHPDDHCGVSVVEHFAAFPRELARRAILAGTSAVGACGDCGAPWRRISTVDLDGVPTRLATVRAPVDLPAMATYLREHRERAGLTKRQVDDALGTKTLYSWFEGRPKGIEAPTPEQWARLKALLSLGDEFDESINGTVEVLVTDGAEQEATDERVRRYGKTWNRTSVTTGWEPTCSCTSEPVACTVLDPFGGSGTTAMAARELGRNAVLVELRREYVVMIRERTRQQTLL